MSVSAHQSIKKIGGGNISQNWGVGLEVFNLRSLVSPSNSQLFHFKVAGWRNSKCCYINAKSK